MRNILCAGLAAVSICTAAPKPAEAYGGGGGGFAIGALLGLGVGAIVGTSIARPYYPYGGYYPYGYYPQGYPYAVPYGYSYAPVVGYPPPPVAYAPPGYPAPLPPLSAGRPANYAAPARPPAAQPKCRSGQFFNTLTGDCDRR